MRLFVTHTVHYISCMYSLGLCVETHSSETHSVEAHSVETNSTETNNIELH